MSKKGRMIYVPPRAIMELENIEKVYKVKRARAFDKMADFVPIGMEAENAIYGTGLFRGDGYFDWLKKKKKK